MLGRGCFAHKSAGSWLIAAVVVPVLLVCHSSQASLIVYGSRAAQSPVSGSLSDVRLEVAFSVAGGYATMTFKNVSVATETAVIADIAIDSQDNDTSGIVLSNPVILSGSPGVSFSTGLSNGIPNFKGSGETSENPKLLALSADSPAPQKGLGLNESLIVRFNTALADGASIDDYFSFFNGGSDTAMYSIAFHAQSCVTTGSSVSGAYQGVVPEPATLALMGVGAIGLIRRRR